MNDEAPILLSERHSGLLVLTLNRPERLNALTPELHEALNVAIDAAADDPEIRAIALTGAGRAFCSGGDLGGGPRERLSHEQRIDRSMHHAECNRLLHEMPKPTIALVNGAAAGAGLSLALSDRAYVIEDGRIVAAGSADEIAAGNVLERAYLGEQSGGATMDKP